MMREFPQFSKLTLEDKPFFDEIFQRFPPYCDQTFSNLWTWDSQNKIQIARLNHNLVVVLTDYKTNEPFLTFIGDAKVVETIRALFDYLDSPPPLPEPLNLLPELHLIPEESLKDVVLPGAFEAHEDRDNFDYIYSLAELSSLAGNRYRGKRNFVHRFNRLYRWQIEELDLSHDATWSQMQNLYRLWSTRQGQKENDVENEAYALLKLRDAAGIIPLLNLGLSVEGRLVGYSLNEINQGDYATNLFEHADTDSVGVFPKLQEQTALKLKAQGYKYLSHQQDLGLAGLRKSKLDYHPVFFLKKYTLQKANN